MPSSDTYGVDGDHLFGRSLKSEGLVEQRHTQRSDTTGRHNDYEISPPTGFREVTSSKWSPATAEAYRPESEAANLYQVAQTNQQFQSLSYGHISSPRPSHPISGELHNADVRFGAGAVAVESLGGTEVATAFSTLRTRIQAFLGDQISPIRIASHLAVIAVAAVVLLVSQVKLPDWQFSLRDVPADGLFAIVQEQSALASGNDVSGATEAFQRAVIPVTSQQTQPVLKTAQEAIAPVQASSALVTTREQIETYSVRSGDTVLGIAARYNLQPETIQWANPELEANPDMLRIGDRLVILPVDGVMHVVQSGDTLSTIAAKYKVSSEEIVAFKLNHLADSSTPIAVGQQLVIPGGNKPYIAKQVLAYNGPVPDNASRGSGALLWPTSGSISQPYWNGHRALDIAAWTGTSVTSADSGYVIAARTGWNNGYGTMVMVDHGSGYVTLYGHMNSIFVRQGESVAKGQQIGTVGNTGNSTGSHLHFEVRYQGVPRNPFNFLP